VYRGSKRAVEKGKEGEVLEAGWKPLEGELGEPQNREEFKGLSGWFSSFVPVGECEKMEQYEDLSGIECPRQTVIMDTDEMSMELAPLLTLVKRAGGTKLLTTVVNVFAGETFTVSRAWLKRQVARTSDVSGDEYEGEWVQVGKRGDLAIRLKGYEVDLGGPPSGGDDVMGTYAMFKLAYEELMINTGLLLLVLEESRNEELAYGDAAKAIIYGDL
jgi:hypothetical protein